MLTQGSQNTCHINPTPGVPAALGGEEVFFSEPRVDLGKRFVTASTAAVVSSFSFVFVAYTDTNGGYFLTGVRALSFTRSLYMLRSAHN